MKPCCMGREERQEEPGGEARESRDSAQPPTTGAGTGAAVAAHQLQARVAAQESSAQPRLGGLAGRKKGEEGGPKW